MHRLYGAVRASAVYTRCSGRRSVYLCASSLQNLAVPHDLYSSVLMWNDPANIVFDSVGLKGLKSGVNAFLLA